MNTSYLSSTRGVCCLFLLVSVSWVFGAPVGRQAAGRAAAGWLKRHPAPMEKRFSAVIKKTEAVADADGQTLYYVVHLAPRGFIILSADDEIEPVIAFSATGRYDGDINSPLTTMLNKDMTGRLAAVERTGRDRGTSPEKRQKWKSLEKAAENDFEMGTLSVPSVSTVWVDPFMQSKWSQENVSGSPCYNYYTPYNYPTGCVATAMAQVMWYYAWPETGIGVKSFTIRVNGYSQPASTRGGDGSGGAYSWTAMPYDPLAGVTTTQRQAIGALCYDAGVSVGMSYTGNGSSASLSTADQQLTATFKFTNSIYTRSFTSSGDSRLWNILNANLDAQMPVILGISRTGGGHAVIADGYGYTGQTLYHHINMGWGGTDNAWYNLPLIDASYTYTMIDDCIYNIYTSGTGEMISGRVTNLAGAPLAGVTVKAYIGTSLQKQVTTNSRGVYALKNLASNTTYRISAEKSGESFFDQNVTTGSSSDWGTPGNRSGVLFVSAASGPPTAFDIDIPDANSLGSTLIELQALDDGLPDPNLLHYIVTSLPMHGDLSEPNVGVITAVPYILAAQKNVVRYTPCPYFGGQDSFTYKANDGGVYPTGGDSNTAAVTVTVDNQLYAEFGTASNTYLYGMMLDTAFFYDARSQVIYLAGEVGAAKRLTDLSIRIGAIPGRTLNNWTIRMQHTNKTAFASSAHEFLTSGWTTVYQGNLTISQTGWLNFHFTTPFNYNGTQNLMVDFSYNNSGVSSPYGGYYIQTVSADRSYSLGSSTGTHGDPLTWGDWYGKYYSVDNHIPSIKFIGVPAVTPLIGDFDATCSVRLPDLMILAAAWNTQLGDAAYNPACDISIPKDNKVDLLDLAVFAEHWMQNHTP